MKKIYLNTLKPEEIIKRLKNGEIIHNEGSASTIKMIDGVIVEVYETYITFNQGFTVDATDDLYFEEEEKFEIKETGLYKTRDGRLAFVSSIKDINKNSYPVVAVILGDIETSTWSIKGKRYDTKESGEDLVEYVGGLK